MKNVFWIGVTFLLLAACSSDDPPPVVTETAPAADESVADEALATVEADTGEDEETLEIVEESAAEPEPEEQAILLAQADVPAVTRQWKYSEGTHYARMVPTQPTVGGADKIEVAEFFWYGCSHCYDFEPFINGWDADKPASVRFVRVPAMWNRILQLHAQLFYTEEVLVRNGIIEDAARFREAVFQEYHRRGNRLTSVDSIRKLFERFGASADEFERTWKSFEVSQKLRLAEDLNRRYGVANVPTMVVNGKYRTGSSEAGGYPNLLELIDELVARESAR
ncbi:MAG: thiol:disulfide interchange protein DsbA/DsbL [Proteobacteria bacterium]|nr:thiol:disulfide interchange protein DsbA/DsbL [Pseudomonadota bacterium]